MIILSQDEEMIVNFDNVESIGMIEFASYISIKAKMQDAYIGLGSYKDLERAKEVLKEIVKAIEGKSVIECNASGMNINTIENKIIYMPKE